MALMLAVEGMAVLVSDGCSSDLSIFTAWQEKDDPSRLELTYDL